MRTLPASPLEATEFVPGAARHVTARHRRREDRRGACSGNAAYSRQVIPEPHATEPSVAESIMGRCLGAHSDVMQRMVVVTANVCTLHPKEFRASYTKQGCSSTARMIILDELFSSLDASIVFVQEARLPEDGVHSTGNYRMYRAGATERGAGGVQIWVRHFLANSVASVKVPSPYLIHLTLQFGPYSVHLVSGHAPIEAAPEHEKASFWESVYKELQPVANDPLHIVLAGIDANARVGSISCPAVGKYNQQKRTETEDGSEQSPPNALSL